MKYNIFEENGAINTELNVLVNIIGNMKKESNKKIFAQIKKIENMHTYKGILWIISEKKVKTNCPAERMILDDIRFYSDEYNLTEGRK